MSLDSDCYGSNIIVLDIIGNGDWIYYKNIY